MKNTIDKLFHHQILNKQEAKQLLIDMTNGISNQSQLAAILTIYNIRTITLEELIGFKEALLELSVKINLSEFKTMDVCGTGGDGKNTFNISTLSAFVIAAAGVPIAKHGNYGVSSVSGSSNVLEQIGIKFTSDESTLKNQLEKTGICFLHAPLFHPALKILAPIRKELGTKTFLNLLGPLVNPAIPIAQYTGVFSVELARLYQYLLQKENNKFSIVHSLDGYDEITLTSKTKHITQYGETEIDAEYFGYNSLQSKELYGGNTVDDAAQLFIKIISGEGTNAQNKVVLANSAIALQTYHDHLSIEECLEKSKDALFSLNAKKIMNQLINLS
jgi:anthranilate phosphoribosyltransferase